MGNISLSVREGPRCRFSSRESTRSTFNIKGIKHQEEQGKPTIETSFFIVNVEAALFRGDRWLVIRRSPLETHGPGLMTLVGGKVDHPGTGDDVMDIVEETIRREVREETGVEVEILGYLESKYFQTAYNEPVVDLVLLCRYAGGEAFIADPAEVAAVYWLTAVEIMESAETPYFLKDTIAKAEKMRVLY